MRMMRKVAIVTDGSSDLPKELVERYQIYIVPFLVIIGSKVYQMYGDYGSISKDDFYDLVQNSKDLPSTSLPAPKSFVDTFRKALESAETVVAILLSSELSATLHSANIAKGYFNNNNIILVDSKVAASTLGILVIEAARMAQNNATANEILMRIRELIPKARLAGILDNVETTYRSGRISWGKKFIAQTLKIRPIVGFGDGKIISHGSIIGSRDEVLKRMKFLAPIVVEKALIDPVFIWHVRALDDAIMLRDIMEENNEHDRELIIQEAGPVIGTHVGIKAMAFMYIGDFNKKWLLKMKR